jgi:hypothetical protein
MSKTVKAIKRSVRPGNTTRPQVISFRITTHQAKTLKEIFDRDPATNIKSCNQLCRKFVCDYLAGRLDYRNPKDKLQDLDTVPA